VFGGEGNGYEVDPPHRLQPSPLAEWLTKELTAQVARQQEIRGKPIKVLGGRLDPRQHEETQKLFKDYVETLVKSGHRNLYAGGGVCTKCHDVKAAKELPEAIIAPDIPTVWFEKSWFSHVAHRAVNCQECHPGKEHQKENDGKTKVVEREPIGILGIDSCRHCHAPAGATLAGSLRVEGGVRHGCTDCHRYHNNQHPLQGMGASARDPHDKWRIQEWLRAGKNGKSGLP
jgi:hypothetical protein